MHFKRGYSCVCVKKIEYFIFENYVMNSNEFKKVFLAKGEENCKHQRIQNKQIGNVEWQTTRMLGYMHTLDSGLQIEFSYRRISSVAVKIFENFITTREQKRMYEKQFYLFGLAYEIACNLF